MAPGGNLGGNLPGSLKPADIGNDLLGQFTYDPVTDSVSVLANLSAAQVGASWGCRVGNSGLVGFAILFGGSGVPAFATNDGCYFFRTDTPAVANQRIYVRSAGAWVGIV